MNTHFFRVTAVILLFCFSCASEDTNNNEVKEDTIGDVVQDVIEDSNVTIIDAEVVYLTVSDLDQVLMELESTLTLAELVQVLIRLISQMNC